MVYRNLKYQVSAPLTEIDAIRFAYKFIWFFLCTALEPLNIEQMAMENDAGAVRVKALFSNIIVKGSSNYTVKEVRSDVKVVSILNY